MVNKLLAPLALLLPLAACGPLTIGGICEDRGFVRGTPSFDACYRYENDADARRTAIMLGIIADTPTPQYQTYRAPATIVVPMPAAPPGPMTVTDPCAMMSCTSAQPPQTPKFIPYTPGGGNPSGYGLLGQ